MKDTETERKIGDILRPAAEAAGYRLVAVRITTESSGIILRVMAENPATRNLGVDECAKLSREFSTLLDVEDPINGAYRLEISSPGIDRPLVSKKDFADYKGFEAKVEIDPPVNGQKRFRGRVIGVEGDDIVLKTEDQGEVALPFESVHKAKLVLTDELIKAGKTAGLTA